MAHHESIQPTPPLHERIRKGETGGSDPALEMASNLAFFLRLKIRDRIDDFLFNSGREQNTPAFSASEQTEIAIAGLQLAYEAVVKDLSRDVEQSEATSV